MREELEALRLKNLKDQEEFKRNNNLAKKVDELNTKYDAIMLS